MDLARLIGIAVACGALASGATWLLLGMLGRIKFGPSKEVIVGVVSGILTTALFWLVALLFNDILLPWYYQGAYRGLDLSGKWQITLGDAGAASEKLEMTADLKQVTDRVSGVLVVVFRDGSGRASRTFSLSGLTRERFLALTAEKVSRKQIGFGTTLVELRGVGNNLRGFWCAYDTGLGQVRCDKCEWKRAREDE